MQILNKLLNTTFALMLLGCGIFFIYSSFSFNQPSHRINYEEFEQKIHTITDSDRLKELLIFEMNYAKGMDDSLITILLTSGGLLVLSSLTIIYLLLKQSKYNSDDKKT